MFPRFTIITYTGCLTSQCQTGHFGFTVSYFETKFVLPSTRLGSEENGLLWLLFPTCKMKILPLVLQSQ